MLPQGSATQDESSKKGGNNELRRGRKVAPLWCREPVKESDPGDPEHHRLLPPSGEHAEESPSMTDRREPLQGGYGWPVCGSCTSGARDVTCTRRARRKARGKEVKAEHSGRSSVFPAGAIPASARVSHPPGIHPWAGGGNAGS